MKNSLLISILFLTSLSINAQTIKVTVNEAQIFAKYGTHPITHARAGGHTHAHTHAHAHVRTHMHPCAPYTY